MKLSILALGAVLATPSLAQADTAADRRHAVENGLAPAVAVEGQSVDGRRLLDQMQALRSPASSSPWCAAAS